MKVGEFLDKLENLSLEHDIRDLDLDIVMVYQPSYPLVAHIEDVGYDEYSGTIVISQRDGNNYPSTTQLEAIGWR